MAQLGLPSIAQRTYAGYSRGQSSVIAAKIDELVEANGDLRILDPMAGQAAELLKLASDRPRLTLTLRDLNPAALYYASARVLASFDDGTEGLDDGLARIDELPEAARAPRPAPFLDAWLPDEHRRALAALGAGVEEPPLDDPRSAAPLIACVLAARVIATYQATKNPTHFRQGGIVRSVGLAETVRSLAPRVFAHLGSQMSGHPLGGRVHLELGDSVEIASTSPQTFDLVVVSPPYGNSLDYSRLWSPELAVVDALHGQNWMEAVRREQLGSVAVAGRTAPDVSSLPPVAQEALADVRADKVPYAETYYYPKFAHFLLGLRQASVAAAGAVASGGSLMVFVRDTVRRDVVVPAGAVVEAALHEAGLRVTEMERLIVRSHVGLRRKDPRPSLAGRAQREWVIEARRQ